MENNKKNYNEAYIRAKEAQAVRHTESHPAEASKDRLPPGQIETRGFPILDLGVRPSLERYPRWTLDLFGNIENPATLKIDEIYKLADTDITADFHCVTHWSRYDLHWSGIPFKKIIELAKPRESVKFLVFHSFDGYTANVSLEDGTRPNVIVATKLEGGEISPEHGGPIRMIIPHLYGWKSAKFLTKIEFLDEDRLGFWEVRGYSNTAQPWLEERYSE